MKSVLPALVLVHGLADCRMKQQMKAEVMLCPLLSYSRGWSVLASGNARDKKCLSPRRLLFFWALSGVLYCGENRYKWRKVLTQGV